MSNISSPELFQLIKKLSKSEKRHFKLFASKHVIGEENKYVKLFDAIEEQNEYQEEELLKLPFVVQLSQLKNRLHELILKSLSAFHSQSSIEKIVSDKIHHIEILTEKGLYVQAKKILQKAKEMAYKYECAPQLLELFNWENRADKTREGLIKFHAEEKRIIKDISLTREYYFLNSQMFLKLRKDGIVRKKEQLKKYKEILSDPLLKDAGLADSFKSKYCYYETLGAYYFFSKNFEKAYTITEQILLLIENNFHRVAQTPFIYINALHNFMECILQTKRYDEFAPILNKLKSVNPKSIRIQTRQFYMVAYNELLFYIETRQFEKGLSVAKKTEHDFKNLTYTINDFSLEFPLYYVLACVYFGNKNYKKALEWNNKILNNQNAGVIREDIYCFAKIFSLVIHYELNNRDLLEYAVISAYRYLYKRERLYQIESAILNFIKTSSASNSKEELITMFKDLKNEFIKIEKDIYEKTAFIYFDYIAWLNDKIRSSD